MTVAVGKTGMRFYVLGLVSLVLCLSLSEYGISVSQFYLLSVWIFSGLFSGKGVKAYLLNCLNNIALRFKTFLHDKTALVLVSLFLLHIVGLAWTSDFQYAFKDLRTKLPLIVFPIIFSSMPRLDKRQTKLVLWCYIAGVFVGTLFSFSKFIRHDFFDIREISLFISHIRFCLSIVFSIFIIVYFLFTSKNKILVKVGMVLLVAWLVWQILIFESFIGVFIMIVLAVLLVGHFAIKKLPIKLTIAIGTAVVVALLFGIWKFFDLKHDFYTPEAIDFTKLDKTTALGNKYIHDTIHFGIEDGKYIGLYYSKLELEQAWEKRSDMDIANTGNLHTLMRYLTSKNLRKDAGGVAQLTDKDIVNIENGVANHNYVENPGIKTRLSKLFIAYYSFENNDPNGSSVFQRVEYIKASWQLIKRHYILGVGTGDIPNTFRDYYDEINSPLRPEYRHRSHNQYLHITVGLGVIGFAWFMTVLLYPYFCEKKNRNYLYSVFLVIIMLSMLSEDTIESQVGVTLYAFFNAFLLFASGESEEKVAEKVPDSGRANSKTFA